MGDSPKWVKSRRRRKKRERKRERLNNGDNNGQATHGARKHAWRTQAAWVNSVCHLISTSTRRFMHRTIISFVQPQPNSIQNKNNPIGCGTAPGNLVLDDLWQTFFLAQAACVRHACLREPCVAWPLLLPSFGLFFFLRLLLFQYFFFHP